MGFTISQAKENSLGKLNKDICVQIHKNHYCVIGKKKRKDKLFIGVEEMDRNFKYVKNKINKNNLKQRIRYRVSKHGTIDQLENVFVFDIEIYNDHEFAEAYAAGLYDVSRLRDKWDKDLTVQQKETEKESVTNFDRSSGNPVMNMLKYISDNYEAN